VNLTGAALNAPNATLVTMPGGIGGVKRTLAVMCDLVRQYKIDLNVRELAVQLVQPCQSKDRRCELATLQAFCRDDIRYVMDVDGVETIQTPVQTLRLQAGDCDDKATLLCAMAASVGFSTRFCAVGIAGEFFSHVMAQARLGSGWVNAETIVPGAELGWFPPDATEFMLAHV